MPTVSRAPLINAMDSEEAAYVAEMVRGYKIAAARGCFIACLFFTLRVVFFVVTGESPSLATSLGCAGLGLAFIVGVLAVAGRLANKPSVKEKEVEQKYVLG